jgi:hypothetical protein
MNRGFRRALVVCAMLLLAWLPVRAEEGGLPEVGKPAPSFDLPATQSTRCCPTKRTPPSSA